MGFLFSKPSVNSTLASPTCLTAADTKFYDSVGIVNLQSIKQDSTLKEFYAPIIPNNRTIYGAKSKIPKSSPYYYVYRLKDSSDPAFANITIKGGTKPCDPTKLFPPFIYAPVTDSQTILFCQSAYYRANNVYKPYPNDKACVTDILNNYGGVRPTVPCTTTAIDAIPKYSFDGTNYIGTQTLKSNFNGYPNGGTCQVGLTKTNVTNKIPATTFDQCNTPSYLSNNAYKSSSECILDQLNTKGVKLLP